MTTQPTLERHDKLRSLNPLTLAGWLIVALVWIAFLTLAYQVTTRHVYGASDFLAYYKGARSFTTGAPLYTGIGGEMPYIYPPLLAMVLAPIAAIADFKTTALLWLAANIIVLLTTLALLSRTIARPRDRMALWLGTVLYASTLQTLWIGQVSIILFALSAGTWLAYRDHRPILAGVLLALAAWLKVYPALILVYFLWRRDWRVVAGAAISGVLIGLIQLAAVGPGEFQKLLTDVLPGLAASGDRLAISNNAILGFTYRLFTPSPGVIPLVNNPALFPAARVLVTLIVVGGTVVVVLRSGRSQGTDEHFDFGYGLACLISMLIGTLYGVHAMMPALLVFFLLLHHAQPRLRLRYVALAILAGALIDLHFLIALGLMTPGASVQFPALELSTPFFGMILLWGMLIAADFHTAHNRD